MAEDAELNRLKTAQDLAFRRKQDAYQVRQRAWGKLSTARDAMNRAFAAKQRAYDDQDRTWRNSQRVRNANGPRIDALNGQQERAYQNMKAAFENASSAHDRGDGAGAASYASDGRHYQAEAQAHVAERRELVEEIRLARAPHDSAKAIFQVAKAEFDTHKRTFNAAKAEHERAQVEFEQAKAGFDSCAKAFKSRLKEVKAADQKRRDNKKTIASKAGVPSRYCDDVVVSISPDGGVNIYFGGAGVPDGPGHGHYAMDASGKVTYKRDPYDPHGTQNFTDQSEGSGGTLYDRRARSGVDPSGIGTRDNETRGRDGTFYDRNREVDLHVTQYYEDGYRVSWDTDGETDRNHHWTNQNEKGGPNRHTPPSDARK